MRVMKTPKSVDISITSQCNLGCKYCSDFSTEEEKRKDLPYECWEKFFEELNRCSVLGVNIGGGEPFVREDLQELINSVKKNRMRFSIVSNGTLITDEMASFLASTGRCSSVQISIDGSSPESHDHFRGSGSFNGAVTGLKFLQKQNIPLGVRATIHKMNVYDLENTAHFLLEELKLPSFSTNAASHFGLCKEYADEIQLSVQERTYAMEVLLKLSQKYKNRIDAAAGPLANAITWNAMEQARKENRSILPDGGYLRSCKGVFSKIAIMADGTIVPCVQMKHIELGQVNKDSLKDLWQTHPELTKLRTRRDIPLDSFEFCKDCDYIPYCKGNCPALAYTITGEENHPSPDACLKRFLEDGGKLPELRQ